MARTRKAIQTLELYKYDVLVEDRSTRSEYFKISQFDGYFYGGRNAFLVAGTGVLRPGSSILVEILNKNGTTVYSVPVKDFVEGNSRLIQVEVYEDTPIGPGKIVILGCADVLLDGSPVPDEWKNKFNVRWVGDVTISPRIENKTPIRFTRDPQIEATEKFYAKPSSSIFSQSIQVPLDINLNTKFYNIFPNGYVLKVPATNINDRFYTKYLGGRITGSIKFNGSNGSETASIDLPIDRIYNRTTAESVGSLIYTDKKTLIKSGFLSSSGQYQTQIEPFGNIGVTSSIVLEYNELLTISTGSNISFAEIRLTDLSTISGEVYKARFSYKSSTSPSNYAVIGDAQLTVLELLAVDSGSSAVSTGEFRNVVLNDYWYAATMSIARDDINPTVPAYYYSSSLVSSTIPLDQCCIELLDAINATPPVSASGEFKDNVQSYFIGTKDSTSVRLFPRSEYTLAFEALVTAASSSIKWSGPDTTLEVYLIPATNSNTKLLDTNPKGQLLGSIRPTTNFLKQNFETVEFNFTPRIISPGEFNIRFVVYGAFWNFANISVKPAVEPFFSPDEVTLLLPNNFRSEDLVTLKAEYLDINNNSIGVETLANPVYFTGSREYVLRSGDTITGDLEVVGEISASSYIVPVAIEPAAITATSANSIVNFDVLSTSVLYYTANAAGNWTLNVRGDMSTTLDSIMQNGETRTVTFLVTNGTTPYYQTAFQIDGSSIVPKWQGATPPGAGSANSVDIYTFSIIKTAPTTFSVFGSKVQFA